MRRTSSGSRMGSALTLGAYGVSGAGGSLLHEPSVSDPGSVGMHDERPGGRQREVRMDHGRHFLWAGPLVMLFAVVALAEAADTNLLAQANAVFAPLPRNVGTSENPVMPERVHLGRLLFFEPRVSSDG